MQKNFKIYRFPKTKTSDWLIFVAFERNSPNEVIVSISEKDYLNIPKQFTECLISDTGVLKFKDKMGYVMTYHRIKKYKNKPPNSFIKDLVEVFKKYSLNDCEDSCE